MSWRISTRAPKRAKASSSLAPPPPPSPPSSPPPPIEQPRSEWASRPLHKLTQFDIPFFWNDPATAWAVEQLQLRQQLGICSVTAPTYTRLVRLFYQNLHEDPIESDQDFFSTIDGHPISIASEMIAQVLNLFIGQRCHPFPDAPVHHPVHRLIQDYFPAARGDPSFTCLRRSKLPGQLLFRDSVLYKNALPLGHKAERRKEFVRVLNGYQYGYRVDLCNVIWGHMLKFLREVVQPQPLQNTVWPLLFANLLTLLFRVNDLSIDEAEEVDTTYPTFGRRAWQHSISRIPPGGDPAAEEEDPMQELPLQAPPVPPPREPLYMTHDEYLHLQHTVDQVHISSGYARKLSGISGLLSDGI